MSAAGVGACARAVGSSRDRARVWLCCGSTEWGGACAPTSGSGAWVSAAGVGACAHAVGSRGRARVWWRSHAASRPAAPSGRGAATHGATQGGASPQGHRPPEAVKGLLQLWTVNCLRCHHPPPPPPPVRHQHEPQEAEPTQAPQLCCSSAQTPPKRRPHWPPFIDHQHEPFEAEPTSPPTCWSPVRSSGARKPVHAPPLWWWWAGQTDAAGRWPAALVSCVWGGGVVRVSAARNAAVCFSRGEWRGRPIRPPGLAS